ncbi:TlpA disulfide reductase family protein [Nocardioides jiangxiensis]|uniref:TlpA disulfide reductase family protein n=1 Tax=Nocardioides jiangxiensis TaxID=3064524 RepID=A0ABT9B170_9ACTN|nr:TlpA disulfide reductase family protein [Nocardioides sp. WY-20]MDO7868595.1 TlpA disulfide reductase family protein [Nocardioides sp. WY-20]
MRAARTQHGRRVAAAALTALLAGPALAACSGLEGGKEGGTATGSGTVTSIEAADRGAPVAFAGTTLDGDQLDIADYRGKVVVLNVWGSWCAPCREEAPALVTAEKDLASSGVAFLGIDVRETSKANADAFIRTYGIPWPSIDDQGGKTLLALRGILPPTATPSTLVLDPKGRVAARILGPVPTAITLKDLAEDAAS